MSDPGSFSYTDMRDIKRQLLRRWDRGEILADIISRLDADLLSEADKSCFPLRMKLKRPSPRQMSECYQEVRQWISDLRKAKNIRLEFETINHKILGKNNIPKEIWIDTMEDAVTLIGKQRGVEQFKIIVDSVANREPSILSWLARKPLKALEHSTGWPKLLSVVDWLMANPRPGIYLRQIDIPGIDSKFVEENRAILIELLDLCLQEDYIDRAATGSARFAQRYGFLDKPARVRFRVLDRKYSMLPGKYLQDITLDVESFKGLSPQIEHVWITENEINFLAFQELESSLVVFGSGYGLDLLFDVPWIQNCKTYYWGDIDTHGLAILDRARLHIPRIRSVLMDKETLLAHRELCGEEHSQNGADRLATLTADENALYEDLKNNVYGERLRLEQERIGWNYAWGSILEVIASG